LHTHPLETTHAGVASLQPGAVVQVRSRRYLVEAVEPATDTSWEQTLIDLSCLDDDAQGERLSVLWEREVDATVLQATPSAISFIR
jgi:hypothetical protein